VRDSQNSQWAWNATIFGFPGNHYLLNSSCVVLRSYNRFNLQWISFGNLWGLCVRVTETNPALSRGKNLGREETDYGLECPFWVPTSCWIGEWKWLPMKTSTEKSFLMEDDSIGTNVIIRTNNWNLAKLGRVISKARYSTTILGRPDRNATGK
jgi:hypothetical protein